MGYSGRYRTLVALKTINVVKSKKVKMSEI